MKLTFVALLVSSPKSITARLKYWALGSRQERSSSYGSSSFRFSLSLNPSSFPAETTEFRPLSANSGGDEEDVVQVKFTTSSNNNNINLAREEIKL